MLKNRVMNYKNILIFFRNHPAVTILFIGLYFLSSLLIFYFTYINYWKLNWGLFPFQFDSQGYGLIVNILFSPVIYVLTFSIVSKKRQ